MKTIIKWLGRLVEAVVVVLVCIAAYIFIASERALERRYDVPLKAFTAPSDAASIQEGRRQAILHGCTSCHGSQLDGLVILDEPRIARIRTPNLTPIVPLYTDAELERLVRRGVKRDGVGLWVMPVSGHMTDGDLEALIAYLRTVPQRPGEPGKIEARSLARLGIVMGQMKSSARLDAEIESPQLDRNDPISFGRYLVKSACTECHGSNLEGSEFIHAPSLMVTAAYQQEDFVRLMRTGIGLGNRELGKMTEMGRFRFSAFTDAEIESLRLYLQEFVRRGGAALP